MEKLLFALLAFAGSYAQSEPVNFKGDIVNNTADSLVVTSHSGQWHKAFALNKQGHFEGTVQQGANIFYLILGKEKVMLWLENDYNLTLTADAKNVKQTLHFDGAGAKENDFMITMERDKETLITKYLPGFTDEVLAKDSNTMVDAWLVTLKSGGLSTWLRSSLLFKIDYIDRKNLPKELARTIYTRRLSNTKSPAFNYENAKGGTTKLADLKGKYVYIDVWATWCGPCREQIPFLQAVEEKYKGRNIAFVSISIDKAQDHDKWAKVVADEALGGIQLLADKDWKSGFIEAYGIHSIPRFILIDPNGNVVEADAMRPANPELEVLLDKLLK